MKTRLGRTYADTLTGYGGIAIAKTKWLYGCNRTTLQPIGVHDGKPMEPQTFDDPQLIEQEDYPPVVGPKKKTGGPRPGPQKGR